MAEPLTPEEAAALRSLPKHGTPFEINGAIHRDGLDFELSDATRYDRRILLVSLRSALATLDAARAAAPLDVIEWLGPCCTHPTPGCTVCGFIPEEARRG